MKRVRKRINFHVNSIGVREMEEWKRVKELVTPGNLIQFGNVSYTTLAACLGLLDWYNNGAPNWRDDVTKVY